MDRLPIQDLERVYESIPSEAIELNQLLRVTIGKLQTCQDQYDEEQRSPPWMDVFRDTIHYLGSSILIGAYIFRSARQRNKTVLSSAIRSGILAHQDIIEAMNNPKKFIRRYDSDDNLIKPGMEEQPIKIFKEDQL